MKTLTNFNKTPLHSINFKTIFSVVALICFTQIGFGQTTIIDFETLNDGYTVSATEGSGYTDVFNRYDGSSYFGGDIGGNTSFVWAVEDLSPTNPTMNLSQIDISGSTSFTFSIDMLAHHFNDWDTTDELLITYSLDGGSYQNLMWVQMVPQGSGSGTNEPAALDTNFDGDGDCGANTTLPTIDTGIGSQGCEASDSDFKTFVTSSITLDNNNTLDIKLQFNGLTSGDEGIYFDNIVVTESSGTPSPTVSFDNSSSSVTETDASFSTNIPVTLTNYSSEVTVSVAIDGSSTAETSDYLLNTTSLIFDNNETNNISLDINSDDDSDDETIVLNITISSGTADFGTSQHILSIIDDDLPSGSIPYSEDFSDCGTQNWTVFTVGAQQEWTCDGDGYFEANAFGSSGAADDYLVSPEFNMDGQSGETLSFTSWTQYADTTYPRIELLYTTNFTGDVSTTTWNSSLSPTFSPENSQAETESGDVDISGLTGTSIVFAFRYTSSGTGVGSTSRWRVDNINIAISVTWQGDDPTTPNDWSTAANWSTGAVPTSSDAVVIDGTFTNEPTISSTDAVALSVTIASGNTLTIDETSSLTVSGDFTNDGTVTLNSTANDFSSLIVSGTATGDITYNRFVNSYDDGLGGGWDLVGSPTVMTITDFTTANGANIEVLGSDYAFSQYDNTIDQWLRYATASQTGSFTSGQGYSMATVTQNPPPPGAAGTAVAFTGAMQTTSQSINVINNNGLNGVGRRWNLVSNPFPSYINGNTAAEAVNNFMDVNSGVIDGSFLGVYGWNGSSYTTYNNTSDAFSIAPGQGFWVAALNTANTPLDFTTAMRTTTGTGDFVAGPQPLVYKLELKLFNEQTQKAATKFYFKDGLSLDLDPGYDAGAYNQSTKLSTRLPQGSQEFAFEINAMGIDALQNTRVPLEIRQNAGQAFTISIADMDLPEDIYVYLEDALNGTLTSLKDQDFELVAQSNLSGVDRFFIVFKSNSVLSNGDAFGIDALNVYKVNTDSFVTITGISPELGQLNVSLYNILGQTVREKSLNPATATQRVSTQGLASGLYIVHIKSGNQTTVKKVIVQ